MRVESGRKFDIGIIYVYAIRIARSSGKEEIYSLIPLLSEERKIRIKKYRCNVNREHCILGEILLKYVLWKHYGLSWKEIQIKYEESGKPCLKGREDIYFNISHSGAWVICGVGNVPIGVDVEGGTKDFMPIARRFFAKTEYEYILRQPSVGRYDAFYKLWTLKESYVKCTGEGLSVPLDSFCFCFSEQGIQMYRNDILCLDYWFKCHKLDNTFHVALCIQDKECNMWGNRVNVISIKDLQTWKAFCAVSPE